MFRQLSFDTSKADVHLALIEDGASLSSCVIAVEDAASGSATARQEAANLLIPGIDRLMRDNGWSKNDLDCIVVGTGPGGFTGIRTAVVTGRALAQALKLPLYPVSILESISESIRAASPEPFAIALYATMGHYFLAVCCQGQVLPSYVRQADLAKAVQAIAVIYADPRARAEMCRADQPVPFSSSQDLRELPEMANIAVAQAKFAWNGLSLKVSAFCETLIEPGQGKVPETQLLRKKLQSELCREFPYDTVVPTYLRAPSVTLKKINV